MNTVAMLPQESAPSPRSRVLECSGGAARAVIVLRTAIVAACLCLLLSVSVHGQSGLRSFLNSPAEKMDEADWALLKSAALEALDDPGANASRSWSNTANDHHGAVTVLKAFDSSDRRPCKRLRFDSFAAGLKGSVSYNVCRSTDGKWRVDS